MIFEIFLIICCAHGSLEVNLVRSSSSLAVSEAVCTSSNGDRIRIFQDSNSSKGIRVETADHFDYDLQIAFDLPKRIEVNGEEYGFFGFEEKEDQLHFIFMSQQGDKLTLHSEHSPNSFQDSLDHTFMELSEGL